MVTWESKKDTQEHKSEACNEDRSIILETILKQWRREQGLVYCMFLATPSAVRKLETRRGRDLAAD